MSEQDKEQKRQLTQWRFDWPSFVIGLILTAVPLTHMNSAQAFDFGDVAKTGQKIASSIKKLSKIKKNLEKDVKALTKDAKTLIGDKDNLFLIKDQLVDLSKKTKKQIESVSRLVTKVEGHLGKTQKDIKRTSKHVNEIDGVKSMLKKK